MAPKGYSCAGFIARLRQGWGAEGGTHICGLCARCERRPPSFGGRTAWSGASRWNAYNALWKL